MKNLPVQPLPPEEQQRLMGRMYLLLGKQVKSYHKHHHMGENSSVPVELAQALMESMEYTVEPVGGFCGAGNAENALKLGQELLGSKVKKANAMLDLVVATAPAWQTECRWEALGCLRQYLASYDHLHLAHRVPDELFYPIFMRVPDGTKGIDLGLVYLNVLWLENQIMAGFHDDVLEQLWNRLPTDTRNQCEPVLLNGLGKQMLHDSSDDLVFEEWERAQLQALLSGLTSDQRRGAVETAAMNLCRKLQLTDHHDVCTAALHLLPRLEAALKYDHLSAVFL